VSVLPKSILIVDDEPSILSLLVEHLEGSGYDAFGAGTAQQAIALLDGQQPVDLLISDFRLNDGMNGLMVAEAALRSLPDIKVLRSLPDIKVLFISGHPYEVWEAESFKQMNALLLGKPFMLDQLDHSIDELLAVAE